MENKAKINEINRIFSLTDNEFIDELNQQICFQFENKFSFIKDKNIIFFDDEIYFNTNIYIRNKLLASNNKIYCFLKDKQLWFDVKNNRQLTFYNIKKLSYDFAVCGCAFFDINGNVKFDEKIYQLFKCINIKEIIVYALSIQMINNIQKNKDMNIHIVTNNFVINNKK